MAGMARYLPSFASAAAVLGVIIAGPAVSEVEHPRIVNPATLGPERAEQIYQAIRDRMRDNYAESGDPLFLGYQTWRRFNRLPYRAAFHGERFVNHYGNDQAGGYAKFEGGGPLPVGAILIKDSFTVTRQGTVVTGPLFLMEKMPADFESPAGSWRFMMLRRNGSLVGMTGGNNAAAVRFCAVCHARAGPDNDYLYFMPDEARPAARD